MPIPFVVSCRIAIGSVVAIPAYVWIVLNSCAALRTLELPMYWRYKICSWFLETAMPDEIGIRIEEPEDTSVKDRVEPGSPKCVVIGINMWVDEVMADCLHQHLTSQEQRHHCKGQIESDPKASVFYICQRVQQQLKKRESETH